MEPFPDQIKNSGAGIRRFFLGISYNGANYGGWQKQNNAPSVQEVLQAVARKVLKQEVVIWGSSRTDAGVHAEGQVAQLDFVPFESLANHRFKLNMALPADIAITWIREVQPQAQCRFDALFRRYEYRISRQKDPFNLGRYAAWFGDLDMASLQACARAIRDTVDFQAFSKVKTHVNHFNCQILEARWETSGDLLVFHIQANRFLRGMVRGLVGTQLEVAKGKRSVADFQKILLQKDRREAGENAPACGLYLTEVGYPESVFRIPNPQ